MVILVRKDDVTLSYRTANVSDLALLLLMTEFTNIDANIQHGGRSVPFMNLMKSIYFGAIIIIIAEELGIVSSTAD